MPRSFKNSRAAFAPSTSKRFSPLYRSVKPRSCRIAATASEWYSSEDKVRDVGFVFARRSLGVLWPQSHLVGHTCRKRGQARSEHRRADQCQTSAFPFGLVRGTSQDGPGEVGISGSASRVSRR